VLPQDLLMQARLEWCRLRGLPAEVDPFVLFTVKDGHRSAGLRGLGRLGNPGKAVLEAEVLSEMLPLFQRLMNETYLAVRTRDRRDGALPDEFQVVRVVKVFNGSAWQGYLTRRDAIEKDVAQALANQLESGVVKDFDPMTNEPCTAIAAALDVPALRKESQEAFLFHGTKPAGAHGITVDLFDLKFARDGLFGRGIYFGESCSKSDEYTQPDKHGLRPILLCRVALGRSHYCDVRDPDRRALEQACTKGGFHSVLGDRRKVHNTFREFICYDALQAYPHFVIWYTRPAIC